MPRRRSSAAQASEAGPAPMRATDEAGVRCRGKGQRSAARVERIHGEALQARDLDRLLVEAVHDAGAFAQDIHRAGAGAAGAQDVGVEDGAGGAGKIAAGDFLDEAGNVDVGGAGGGARRIEAVEATIGLGYRCLPVEGRMQIAETRGGLRMIRGLLQKRCLATHSGGSLSLRRWSFGRGNHHYALSEGKIRISPYHH